MSTSRGDSEANVTANRQIFLNEFGANQTMLAEPLQVGGEGIKIVENPGKYTDQDALITTTPGLFLRVLTADCAPILIWSMKTPLIAAVHSGWQGSELDILGKTLKMIQDELGADMESLCVVIGPGLSEEKFEVGLEFSDKFSDEYLKPINNGTKFLFNNNAYLYDTVKRFGVPAAQIEIMQYCSYRDDDLFFSHRRDKGTTGRMMSVIGINK